MMHTKKLFLADILFLLLLISFPIIANACPSGIVTCDGTSACPCTWDKVGAMLLKIWAFVVWDLAVPGSVVAIIIGAIILLTSAGNPGQQGLGKKVLFSAIIGLVLALCSAMIINIILKALGSGKTVTLPNQ